MVSSKCLLHRSHVHADEFLVEGDGQGDCSAQGEPILRAIDAGVWVLLNGVNIVACQLAPVGSVSVLDMSSRRWHPHATLNLLLAVHPGVCDLMRSSSLTEFDGANLQLHAVESALQLLLQSGEHLVVGAHPYQSVDGDTLLAPCEGRVRSRLARYDRPCRHIDSGALTEEVGKGGLQSEGDAGVGTYHVVGYAPHLFHHLAHPSERELRIRVWRHSSGRAGVAHFAHAPDARNVLPR